jgi:Conjugal transfer protein TraD
MARTLAERLRAHEQSKARLAEAEARLKLDERRQRTRRLVEAGALAEKAGLLELDSNALYGALLSLRDGADNAGQVEQWAALGGRAFAREARARDEGKEPVLLSFTAALAKDVTIELRKAGFRYSRVMQHWEGLARFDDARALAETHGGTARRVSATAATTEGEQKEAAE